MKKIKPFIQYSVIVLFIGFGVLVANFIKAHFKQMGVNFVTFENIIELYIGSIVILGLIGIYIGAIWLEEKL